MVVLVDFVGMFVYIFARPNSLPHLRSRRKEHRPACLVFSLMTISLLKNIVRPTISPNPILAQKSWTFRQVLFYHAGILWCNHPEPDRSSHIVETRIRRNIDVMKFARRRVGIRIAARDDKPAHSRCSLLVVCPISPRSRMVSPTCFFLRNPISLFPMIIEINSDRMSASAALNEMYWKPPARGNQRLRAARWINNTA